MGWIIFFLYLSMGIWTHGYLYTCKANLSERSMMVEDSSKRNEERKALDEGGVIKMMGFNEFGVCTNTRTQLGNLRERPRMARVG